MNSRKTSSRLYLARLKRQRYRTEVLLPAAIARANYRTGIASMKTARMMRRYLRMIAEGVGIARTQAIAPHLFGVQYVEAKWDLSAKTTEGD